MKKQYPANLLKAIRLNEICGAAIDYGALTADQQGGLTNLLARLTERNALSWTNITAKASP